MEAVTFLLQLLITDSACVCLAVSGMGVRAEDGMCEGRVLSPPPPPRLSAGEFTSFPQGLHSQLLFS